MDKSSDGNDNTQGVKSRRVSKTEKTISDAMRKKVLKRDGHKCQSAGMRKNVFSGGSSYRA